MAVGAAMYDELGLEVLSAATEARIVETFCTGAPATPSDAQTARVLAMYYGHPCIPRDATEAV